QRGHHRRQHQFTALEDSRWILEQKGEDRLSHEPSRSQVGGVTAHPGQAAATPDPGSSGAKLSGPGRPKARIRPETIGRHSKCSTGRCPEGSARLYITLVRQAVGSVCTGILSFFQRLSGCRQGPELGAWSWKLGATNSLEL